MDRWKEQSGWMFFFDMEHSESRWCPGGWLSVGLLCGFLFACVFLRDGDICLVMTTVNSQDEAIPSWSRTDTCLVPVAGSIKRLVVFYRQLSLVRPLQI